MVQLKDLATRVCGTKAVQNAKRKYYKMTYGVNVGRREIYKSARMTRVVEYRRRKVRPFGRIS